MWYGSVGTVYLSAIVVVIDMLSCLVIHLLYKIVCVFLGCSMLRLKLRRDYPHAFARSSPLARHV